MKLAPAYTLVKSLSLDVVWGALCSLYLASVYFQANIPWPVGAEMALAVWLFYLADHWMDAQGGLPSGGAARHHLFWQHKNKLRVLMLLLALVCLVLVPFIPVRVIGFGFALALANVLYLAVVGLSRQKQWFIPKEILIALIYTLGTWGAPMVLSVRPFSAPDVLMLSVFFCLVLLEGMMAAWFDYAYDTAQQHSSFVRQLGKTKARTGMLMLAVFVGAAVFLLWYLGAIAPLLAVLFGLMLIGILLPFWAVSFWEVNDRFRTIGELVFCLPILYYWLQAVL